jgi:predicted transglutaminase-like cysteine proteinase
MAAWLAGSILVAPTLSAQEAPRCTNMTIPIASVEDPPLAYRDFCGQNEQACKLSGPSIVQWSRELHGKLQQTNMHVNDSVEFVPDPENSGEEEVWDFPSAGKGDCEDFMLEKRKRLIDAGLPSASMTCGIAFHQVQLFPHAVLLVETTAGTFVLDNIYDEVLCWDAVPYFYTRRERPDGQWTRFQQP